MLSNQRSNTGCCAAATDDAVQAPRASACWSLPPSSTCTPPTATPSMTTRRLFESLHACASSQDGAVIHLPDDSDDGSLSQRAPNMCYSLVTVRNPPKPGSGALYTNVTHCANSPRSENRPRECDVHQWNGNDMHEMNATQDRTGEPVCNGHEDSAQGSRCPRSIRRVGDTRENQTTHRAQRPFVIVIDDEETNTTTTTTTIMSTADDDAHVSRSSALPSRTPDAHTTRDNSHAASRHRLLVTSSSSSSSALSGLSLLSTPLHSEGLQLSKAAPFPRSTSSSSSPSYASSSSLVSVSSEPTHADAGELDNGAPPAMTRPSCLDSEPSTSAPSLNSLSPHAAHSNHEPRHDDTTDKTMTTTMRRNMVMHMPRAHPSHTKRVREGGDGYTHRVPRRVDASDFPLGALIHPEWGVRLVQQARMTQPFRLLPVMRRTTKRAQFRRTRRYGATPCPCSRVTTLMFWTTRPTMQPHRPCHTTQKFVPIGMPITLVIRINLPLP